MATTSKLSMSLKLTKPRAQKRIIKTISKAFRAELTERNFVWHSVPPAILEIRSFSFEKNAIQVYIHEYVNSIVFMAVHNETQQRAEVQIWTDKYEKSRPYAGCAVTILMEKMYKIAIGILEPQVG